MDQIQPHQDPVPAPHEAMQTAGQVPKLHRVVIISIIILSFIFGTFGGIFGFYYASKDPAFVKSLSASDSQSVNQSISISEDSAVIDVVKKASPAVVSIVISQDVNQIPGYGTDPLGGDPFNNFFFGSGGQSQQQPQSTAPNVQETGAGSGFFISADGLIITNKHVVDQAGASYTVFTSDGKKYDATVLSRDPVNDLALVKIKISNAPFLNLADSKNIQVGQRVIAIGNSLGQYQNTVTTGVVSGVGRKITAGDETGGSEDLSNVIQTDAAINPGNSGGPLLDVTGSVIGINTAIDQQGQLVGFAIPSNEASNAIASFQKNGKIVRPYLGVRYIIITPDIAQQENLPKDYGALIVPGQTQTDVSVVPGSPANKAGLVENDIILQVNGTNVDQNNSLSDLLNMHNVGDIVTLQVYDKGQVKNVQVSLGEAPGQ